MGQQHDLAGASELDQLRTDRRLVLEYIEAGAGDLLSLDQPRQRILVDHLAARGIDDIGVRANELEAACRKQMVRRRRVRTIDRDDVHAREHLVEAFPVRRVQLLLDLRRDAAAIVIVNLQSEGVRTARYRLADAAHADDAETLAPDTMAEHPGWAPAGPFAIAGEHLRAFCPSQ